MSNWTYICGSVCLNAWPFKIKKNKDGSYKVDKKQHDYHFYENRYLPFGERQIEFMYPRMRDTKMSYKVNITSFPVIDEAVSNSIKLMPQGERKLFYMLNRYSGNSSSHSTNISKHVNDLFYKHLKEVNKDHVWPTITRKELDDCFASEMSWINFNTESVLTIYDSVRDCTSRNMYEALIEFMGSLLKAGVSFDEGILTFNDCVDSYVMRFNDETIAVEINGTMTEYWQVFTKRHFIYDDEFELRKVEHFVSYNDCVNNDASDNELAEYKKNNDGGYNDD